MNKPINKLIILLLIILLGYYSFSFIKKVIIIIIFLKLLSLFISSSGDTSKIKVGQLLPDYNMIKLKEGFKKLANKFI